MTQNDKQHQNGLREVAIPQVIITSAHCLWN